MKLPLIGRLESGKHCGVITATYNAGLSTIYGTKKQKDQLQSSTASSKNTCKNLGQDSYCFII
jgi:hypothetical protein